VLDVHAKWKIHEQLFGSGQKRLDLLMRTSPNFFAIIQETLLISIQLTISKLGDPAKSGKFDNMTLAKLVAQVQEHDMEGDVGKKSIFNADIDTRLVEFGTASDKVRERRNKLLAHLDYGTALNLHPMPITGVTRKEIEAALSALRTLVREVEDYVGESPTAYQNVVLTWDGDLLISSLKHAQRYLELEKDGTVSYDDWRTSQWADA
jgi:hypothetical protein